MYNRICQGTERITSVVNFMFTTMQVYSVSYKKSKYSLSKLFSFLFEKKDNFYFHWISGFEIIKQTLLNGNAQVTLSISKTFIGIKEKLSPEASNRKVFQDKVHSRRI